TNFGDWRAQRNYVLASGRIDAALRNVTQTGRIVGGAGLQAKDCTTPLLQARLSPITFNAETTLPSGAAIHFSAMEVSCLQPPTDVTIAVKTISGPMAPTSLTLADGGNGVDGDGVYSVDWVPPG